MPSILDSWTGNSGSPGILGSGDAAYDPTLMMIGLQMLANSQPQVGKPTNLFDGIPQVIAQGTAAAQKRAEKEAAKRGAAALAETLGDDTLKGAVQAMAAYDPDTATKLVGTVLANKEKPQAPELAREFLFAKQGGFKGSFTDYVQWKTLATNKPTPDGRPAGYGAVPPGFKLNPDGSMVAVAGGPADIKSRNLSAGDKSAVMEAEDLVQSGVNAQSAIERALSLNDKIYSGATAGAKAWYDRNAPSWAPGSDPNKGANTTEFNTLVSEQALSQMKQIFGGNPTEGERAILLDLQALSDKSPEERKRILTRARDIVSRRIAVNKERAQALRSGTYYNPGYDPQATKGVMKYNPQTDSFE